MKWTAEEGRLEIRTGFGQGCIGAVLVVLGLSFVVIAMVVGVGFWTKLGGSVSFSNLQDFLVQIQTHISDFIPVFVLFVFGLFGLLFIFVGFSKFGKSDQPKVILDPVSQKVRYDIGDGKDGYEFSFGEVAYIDTCKEVRTSSGGSSGHSSSYTAYVIQLVKTDGALFWIDTFTVEKIFKERMQQLLDLSGFELRDRSGVLENRPAAKQYEKRMPSMVADVSSVVRIEGTSMGTRVEIKKKSSLMGRFVGLILLLLFLSLPAIGLFLAYSHGNLGFRIGFTFFAVIFYGFTFIGILVGLKKYIVDIRGMEVHVFLKFKLGFLNNLFGKEITIDASSIKTVRLNFYEGQGFQLSLGIDPPIPMKGLSSALFNAGAFRKNKGALTQSKRANEQEIGLWMLQPGVAKNGLKVSDLVYLESFLQDTLSVRED